MNYYKALLDAREIRPVLHALLIYITFGYASNDVNSMWCDVIVNSKLHSLRTLSGIRVVKTRTGKGARFLERMYMIGNSSCQVTQTKNGFI